MGYGLWVMGYGLFEGQESEVRSLPPRRRGSGVGVYDSNQRSILITHYLKLRFLPISVSSSVNPVEQKQSNPKIEDYSRVIVTSVQKRDTVSLEAI
jgi:hypothetical protein